MLTEVLFSVCGRKMLIQGRRSLQSSVTRVPALLSSRISVTVQPRSRGFPEGFLARPFYGRVTQASRVIARLSGLLNAALACVNQSTLKRAHHQYARFSQRSSAGLEAMRQKPSEAGSTDVPNFKYPRLNLERTESFAIVAHGGRSRKRSKANALDNELKHGIMTRKSSSHRQHFRNQGDSIQRGTKP